MEVGTEGEAMSETLIPTMHLRFVRKMVTFGELGSWMTVLQQGFTVAETGKTVWKDVPLETEAE